MNQVDNWEETVIEQTVTYTIEINGRIIVIEGVPARVSLDTGERYFAPATVERIQKIVWGQERPLRTMSAPVYAFAT